MMGRVDTNGELSPPCLWVRGQEGQCEDVRVQLHALVRVSERVALARKRGCVSLHIGIRRSCPGAPLVLNSAQGEGRTPPRCNLRAHFEGGGDL